MCMEPENFLEMEDLRRKGRFPLILLCDGSEIFPGQTVGLKCIVLTIQITILEEWRRIFNIMLTIILFLP